MNNEYKIILIILGAIILLQWLYIKKMKIDTFYLKHETKGFLEGQRKKREAYIMKKKHSKNYMKDYLEKKHKRR